MNLVKNRYFLMILFYLSIMVLIAFVMPREIDWQDSFSANHKIPYGCYILKDRLTDIFTGDIKTVDQPIYNELDESLTSPSNYIFINRQFGPSKLDLEYLLNNVSSGSFAFISAARISTELLDTLGVHMEDHVFSPEVTDSGLQWGFPSMSVSNLPGQTWKIQADFHTYYFESNSIEIEDIALGKMDSGYINFIRVPYQNGAFYLHTCPWAFTNFNLLKDDNHRYASGLLSFLPDQFIRWDEYYKAARSSQFTSPLAVLLKNRSSKMAIYIALVGLLLFMVFHAKRRQKVIPVIRPYENSSLEFVKTLGDLYYRQGDHADLAKKKISYLREHLNRKFHFHDLRFVEDEIPVVAGKTGHNAEFLEGLFQLVNRIENDNKVSAELLTTLAKKLNSFYNPIR